MAGSSRPPLVIRCEKMRIAWVLSISRIRKAGKSLTAPGGPGSPGVDLAGRGWARPSSRGPTWPLSCLGCAIADDLYSRQRRATRNGCEMRQEAPRLRVWRENATQVAMVQLLYYHVVASILVAWAIQGHSHNHLCIKNSCQKQIFKKAEKLGNTKLPEMSESDRSPQSRFLLSFLLSGNGEQQVETGFPVLFPVLAPETNRDHISTRLTPFAVGFTHPTNGSQVPACGISPQERPGLRRSARGAAMPTIPRSGIVASWLDILRRGTRRRPGRRRAETRK